MSDTISFATSVETSRKSDQLNAQSVALTTQQCTTDFSQYLVNYNKPSNPELTLLFPDAASIISHYFQLPTPLLVINSRHWLSAEQLLKQVIPSSLPTNYLLSYNQENLLLVKNKNVQGEKIIGVPSNTILKPIKLKFHYELN